MFDPRLVVAVHAAIRQRIGFRKTTSIPSRISGMKPEVPDAVLGRGSGSGFVMEASASADRKNDTASTATAFAPPINWMRNPATAGPATCAVDRVISSLVWPPNTLTLSPAQSLRKSGWRHSLPRNTARFYPERTLEEGNARQRELCPQPRHRHAAGRGALWPRLCAHTGQSGFRGAAHRCRFLRWPGTGLRPRARVTASRRHRV